MISLPSIPDESWTSPKGNFGGSSKEISVALGCDSNSPDPKNRHPFEVELCTVPPGKKACPFHSHSAQWEFYHVLSGTGLMRHAEGTTSLVPGDAMIFPPDEPHQIINNGTETLVVYIVADNVRGESCHYPDSRKWLVRSPTRQLIRSGSLEYYDGEE